MADGKLTELRVYLAANASVAETDGFPEKAKLFREWLELVAKLAEPAPVTDEQVDAAGREMYPYWDIWPGDDPMGQGTRQMVRTALEAAQEAGR